MSKYDTFFYLILLFLHVKQYFNKILIIRYKMINDRSNYHVKKINIVQLNYRNYIELENDFLVLNFNNFFLLSYVSFFKWFFIFLFFDF